MKLGQHVRVSDNVEHFGGAEGTVAGFAGLVCEGAVYVAIPGWKIETERGPLPGVPFDPHELEVIG